MATTTLSPAPSPVRDERAVAAPGAARRDTEAAPASAWHRRGAAVLGSRLLPVAVVAVPMVVLVVSQLRQAGAAGPVVSDFALLELGTSSASRGEQLLGPYSRFRWNHPGPFLFYWNVPFWAATGRQIGGLALAAAVLNTLTLTGLVEVAGRVGGRVAAWCAAGGVLVLLARYDIERMREVWNPTLTVTTTALTIGLAVAVAVGRRWALPGLALVASATVQTHVGTGPTVAAVVLVALMMAMAADRRHLGRWVRPALAMVAVVVALWALPAVEQAGGGRDSGDGNVTELVTFFTDDGSIGPGRRASLQAIIKLVAAQDPNLSVYAGPAGGNFPNLPALSKGDIAGVTVLVGLLMLGAGVAAAARDRRLGAWAVLPLVALAAGLVSATSVDGPLYLYLLAFVTGTALVAWIAAAVVVVDLASRVRRALSQRRRRAETTAPLVTASPSPPNPVIAALVAVATGIGLAAAVQPAGDIDPYAEQMRSAPAVDLLPALMDTVVDADADVVLLRIGSPEMWEVTTPLADALVDEGIDVRIDPEWLFMFGDQHRTDGEEDLIVTVLPSTDSASLGALAVIDESAGVTLAIVGTGVGESSPRVGIGSPADDD